MYMLKPKILVTPPPPYDNSLITYRKYESKLTTLLKQ